jgi:hypothetical protein
MMSFALTVDWPSPLLKPYDGRALLTSAGFLFEVNKVTGATVAAMRCLADDTPFTVPITIDGRSLDAVVAASARGDSEDLWNITVALPTDY